MRNKIKRKRDNFFMIVQDYLFGWVNKKEAVYLIAGFFKAVIFQNAWERSKNKY